MATKAYGNYAPEKDLELIEIERREVKPTDVEIDILFCGICHSDLHTARNEWGGATYPVVPGHEIVGKVTKVGDNVSKFKVGQIVGVGCLVDSCQHCENCKNDWEQFCLNDKTFTYNSVDKNLEGKMTYGGYSEKIVVDQNFVLSIPENLDLAATAPLLCAGITTYSPLKRWGAGPGKKVGVVGIGGLGHMAIKIAKAMGAYVVVFTSTAAKTQDAMRLGADEVVLSSNPEQMENAKNSLNLIIDTVSAQHEINSYLQLLKVDGTLVLVGAPSEALPVSAFSLIGGRRNFAGSLIGGIAETQEMLDFCGKHNIVSDIELIGVNDINNAYERLLKSDVRYRFVIDIASLKN